VKLTITHTTQNSLLKTHRSSPEASAKGDSSSVASAKEELTFPALSSHILSSHSLSTHTLSSHPLRALCVKKEEFTGNSEEERNAQKHPDGNS